MDNVAAQLHMGPGQIAPTLEAVDAPHIRRAIDCFGADRVVWAADKTSNVLRAPWSDMVHSVRDDPELSHEEKAWIMGKTARRIIDWPDAAGSGE